MLMSHVNYIQNEWTWQSARAEGFPTHVHKPTLRMRVIKLFTGLETQFVSMSVMMAAQTPHEKVLQWSCKFNLKNKIIINAFLTALELILPSIISHALKWSSVRSWLIAVRHQKAIFTYPFPWGRREDTEHIRNAKSTLM